MRLTIYLVLIAVAVTAHRGMAEEPQEVPDTVTMVDGRAVFSEPIKGEGVFDLDSEEINRRLKSLYGKPVERKLTPEELEEAPPARTASGPDAAPTVSPPVTQFDAEAADPVASAEEADDSDATAYPSDGLPYSDYSAKTAPQEFVEEDGVVKLRARPVFQEPLEVRGPFDFDVTEMERRLRSLYGEPREVELTPEMLRKFEEEANASPAAPVPTSSEAGATTPPASPDEGHQTRSPDIVEARPTPEPRAPGVTAAAEALRVGKGIYQAISKTVSLTGQGEGDSQRLAAEEILPQAPGHESERAPQDAAPNDDADMPFGPGITEGTLLPFTMLSPGMGPEAITESKGAPQVAQEGPLPALGDFQQGKRTAYRHLFQALAAHDLYAVKDFVKNEPAALTQRDASGFTPYLFAASIGYTPAVTALARSGKVDLSDRDNNGNTALHLAARNNHESTVRRLCALTPDLIESRNDKNYTALHVAAESGALASIRALRELGADTTANVTEEQPSLPLIVAAKAKQWNAVHLLRQIGPDWMLGHAIQFGDFDSVREMIEDDPRLVEPLSVRNLPRTPLMFAIMFDQLDIALYLIEQGAMLNATTIDGDTALSIAIDERNEAMANMLLWLGVDINNPGGGMARESILHRLVRRGPVEMIPYALEQGADVLSYNRDGELPIHVAAAVGNTDVARQLIEAGADVNARMRKTRRSPLHCAAENGMGDMISFLVEHGAEIDCWDNRKQATPLQLAIRNRHPDAVRRLLNSGASATLGNLEASTPLHIAAVVGDTGIARLLVNHGAQLNAPDGAKFYPIHRAAMEGNWDILEFFMNQGQDINVPSPKGVTPVAAALGAGKFKVAVKLAQRGADTHFMHLVGSAPEGVNLETQPQEVKDWLLSEELAEALRAPRLFPVVVAARSAPWSVLQLLLVAKPSSADQKNTETLTPVMAAAEGGNIRALQTLLQNGADPNKETRDKRTALHFAAEANQAEAIQVLADYDPATTPRITNTPARLEPRQTRREPLRRADLNARDAEGWTPLLLAARAGAKESVVTLVKNGAQVMLSNYGGAGLLDAVEQPLEGVTAAQQAAVREVVINELVRQLHEAVRGNQLGLTVWLAKSFPQILNIPHEHLTALQLAVENGSVYIVKELLFRGADPNPDTPGTNAATPLHAAATRGESEMVDLLLQHGADTSALDESGRTAAAAARMAGHVELADRLEPAPRPVAQRVSGAATGR